MCGYAPGTPITFAGNVVGGKAFGGGRAAVAEVCVWTLIVDMKRARAFSSVWLSCVDGDCTLFEPRSNNRYDRHIQQANHRAAQRRGSE